uniref:Uncharacterized protein n=2 Tax=Panagrolaimus sp. ES5 TaxID=591445 RepID=A0AC34GFQ3_9BILA
MDYAEKLIYVCKECIAINKIYGNVISSISARQFEPFDQELYHDEVVCIITLACQNFPSRIHLVTLACGLLSYKYGAKLLVKLILNQCNTIDLILQTFSELRFPSEIFICHERDSVMLEVDYCNFVSPL